MKKTTNTEAAKGKRTVRAARAHRSFADYCREQKAVECELKRVAFSYDPERGNPHFVLGYN